ncbi:hypothetical protein NXV14_09170 [Bacteroides fragilis]|nr:hypothetical protein [Bacteroides fragilis]
MNEDLIKQEFVRENIERDIRAIFEAQYLIATERVYTSAIYPTQVGQRRSLVREQGYGRPGAGYYRPAAQRLTQPRLQRRVFGRGGGRHFQRPPLYPLPGYEETWKLWHL